MSPTMKAVVCHGPMDYKLEDVEIPTPTKGEALVRVEAVGICASDLKCYHGASKFWGDANRPAYAETEVIPGHEFVGEIAQIDEEASKRWGVVVGDRVVAEQIVPCEECRYCKRGEYWMCAPHGIFGFKRKTPGAMASYMIFSTHSRVHKISKSVKPAHAAYAEPLSCALHAVERAKIKNTDVVVVAGCGPIGLGMIAGAAVKKPAILIALDLDDRKLAVAKECGATLTINIGRENAIEIVRELTEGYGADIYLEGTGHPSAVAQGLQILRKLGTFVLYSVFKEDVTVDWSIISDDKELDLLGAHLGPHCWPAAIAMIESGKLPLDKICTHQLPLADFQKGLDMVSAGNESIKVSLIP
ncbi:MAG: alcohol dehydrogenase catalytic domain-containing protein [Actinobacteria bacterium]|nr:alcohol dehydrogenase catalytic domain-containing protein [Actinomycetota bacterium]